MLMHYLWLAKSSRKFFNVVWVVLFLCLSIFENVFLLSIHVNNIFTRKRILETQTFLTNLFARCSTIFQHFSFQGILRFTLFQPLEIQQQFFSCQEVCKRFSVSHKFKLLPRKSLDVFVFILNLVKKKSKQF